MASFSRRAQGLGRPQIFDVSRPHGFFGLLDRADLPFALAVAGGNMVPLARICSQARAHGVCSVVLESLGHSDDVSTENMDLEALFIGPFHDVWRLSFFTCPLAESQNFNDVDPRHFIGYLIWKVDGTINTPGRVFESVIPPPQAEWRCFHKTPTYEVRIGNCLFHVTGHLFSEQNSQTNCCAHTALRTAVARFRPDNDITFREMNDILGYRGADLSRSGKGLTTSGLAAVLDHVGAGYRVVQYHDLAMPQQTVPWRQIAYGSIESGYPVIVVFGDLSRRGREEDILHAIPLFGHTFNPDMWLPRAEMGHFSPNTDQPVFTPSSWFLGSFIGHDDNFGPNFSIPQHYMQSLVPAWGDHPRHPATEGVAWVLTTGPKECTLSAEDAQMIVMELLLENTSISRALRIAVRPNKNPNPWLRRLLAANKRHIILRPILLSGPEYAQHLRTIRDWDNEAEGLSAEWIESHPMTQMRLNSSDQDLYWMVEISLPELFPANKRKLGEVLISACPSISGGLSDSAIHEAFVGARLPGSWITFNQKARQVHPRVVSQDCPLSSHTELFGCEPD